MQYLLTLESKYLELGNIFFFEFLSLYKMHIQSCLQKIGISLSLYPPWCKAHFSTKEVE